MVEMELDFYKIGGKNLGCGKEREQDNGKKMCEEVGTKKQLWAWLVYWAVSQQKFRVLNLHQSQHLSTRHGQRAQLG